MNDKRLIMVDVRQGDIEHSLTIEDFKQQLLAEIGSVTWIITRKQFQRTVSTAVDRVIQRIRDERLQR